MYVYVFKYIKNFEPREKRIIKISRETIYK